MKKILRFVVPALALGFLATTSTDAEAGSRSVRAHSHASAHARPQIKAPPTMKVWVPGHFELTARGIIWVAGEYRIAPRAKSVYVPGYWKKTRHGKVWVAGYWT